MWINVICCGTGAISVGSSLVVEPRLHRTAIWRRTKQLSTYKSQKFGRSVTLTSSLRAQEKNARNFTYTTSPSFVWFFIWNKIEQSYRRQVYVGIGSLLLFHAPSLTQVDSCQEAESQNNALCHHDYVSRYTWPPLRLIYWPRPLVTRAVISVDRDVINWCY